LRLAGLSAADRRLLYGEFYYNVGGSILLIARKNDLDRWAVDTTQSKNRRIHGLSGLAINKERSDGYKNVTSWGSNPHQQGDENYLIGTGPAATQVFNLSSDGLGNRIIGTAYNCSSATTPWGTIMSAEENFQGSTSGGNPAFIGVQENVLPNGTQMGYIANTVLSTGAVVAGGNEFGLVGEKYGWLVEIDPDDANFRPRKHTALGRFRHENITLRVEKAKPLVAYLGDDRRGGHTYKYVSKELAAHRRSKTNSRLLEEGTLYVARYNPDGSGRWLPLMLTSPPIRCDPRRSPLCRSPTVSRRTRSSTAAFGCRGARTSPAKPRTAARRSSSATPTPQPGRSPRRLRSRIFPPVTSTRLLLTSTPRKEQSCAMLFMRPIWWEALQPRVRKIWRSTHAIIGKCSSRSPTARRAAMAIPTHEFFKSPNWLQM
jgi:secreted PhoX family phosphatase